MSGWLGYLGVPPDPVAWTALGLSLLGLLAVYLCPRWFHPLVRSEYRWYVIAGLAGCAALLSFGYVEYYLRGGPRIIDATAYYLQARVFAHGSWTLPLHEPTTSFRGRFLLPSPDSSTLGVIFPPGYPAVLSLGFLVGAPMLVGPVLAAGLVVATYALARHLSGREDVALLAAALSATSAGLRYHTADTMSHGWSALLLVLALLAATKDGRLWSFVAGSSTGWLVATRPFSGLALLILVLALIVRDQRKWGAFVVGLLPGLALLMIHQRVVTGQWGESAQLLYYGVADGPPGCFKWGFGKEVGCRFEHGGFREAALPHGFALLDGLRITGIRLQKHLRDAANFQPLALVLLVGAIGAVRRRQLLLPSCGVLAVVLVYVPFYYDGSYPGGGARFYADVLPLEHILIAYGAHLLRGGRWLLPMVGVGFALQTSFDHRALSSREGGHPMFERSVLRANGIERGLVLVDTDHGFDLGYDPGARNATDSTVVARARGDASDSILWDSLGRPPSFRYEYDLVQGQQRLVPQPIPPPEGKLRFEAEHSWPVAWVKGGWVLPDFPPCASAGRALQLRVVAGGSVQAGIPIYVPRQATYEIRVGWARIPGAAVRVQVSVNGSDKTENTEQIRGLCWVSQLPLVRLERGPLNVVVRSSGSGAEVDFVELEAVR